MADDLTPGTELTLEQLHEIQTDPESEKKAAQSVMLPLGTYNSVPELAMTLRVAGADAKTPGRHFARYFGPFVGTGTVTGQSGHAGFAVSWQPIYKDDGKADLMTRLFNQAAKTYRLAMGLPDHEQVPVAAVLEYIQKYAVAVRFGQGDDDNIAFSISAAKE